LPALIPNHARPIKPDESENKSMTLIDFALLINASARLVGAIAKFVYTYRRRR
jgi:hypothetical protein